MLRRVFLGGLSALALAGPAAAEALSLGAISNYLNTVRTAQGEFTQISGDTIVTGTVYIWRPGRVRFEYNPPERTLVLANNSQVALFDGRSNVGPERYPLNQTPLSIVLASDVDLGRANMVTAHTSDGTRTTVRAQDPDHPEYGHIDMVFTANPVQLRQWVVTDDSGQQTTVILGEMTEGLSIPRRQFNMDRAIREFYN